MPDLGSIGNYANFDERRGTLTLHYKEGGMSTIETAWVGDIDAALATMAAQGWEPTAPSWEYSVLEGHTIGIKRKDN